MVLEELGQLHGPVCLERLGYIVMGLEQVVELVPALLGCFAAVLDIRVPARLELGLDFVDLQGAVAVLVKLGEGEADEAGTEVVEGAEDGAHELIEVDGAVAVVVEGGEDLFCFLLGAADLVVVEGFLELLEVQGPAFVGVHELELALESDQALGASLHQLLLESAHYNLVLLLLSHCIERLGVLLLLLGRAYMLRVLGVDIGDEGVLAAFHSRDLLVLPLGLLVVLGVRQTLSQWTALLLIVSSLAVAQGEVGGDHATADGGLAVGFSVLALVGAAAGLGALVFHGPGFLLLLVGGSVS